MRKSRLIAVLMLAVLAAFSFAGTSGAYFTHSQTTEGITITAGSWVEPPHICSIIPCTWLSGGCFHALVLGGGFSPGAKVELVRGDSVIEAESAWLICPGSISCWFNLRGASGGFWDVRVINPDGGIATLKNGFLVIGCPLLKIHEGEGDPGSGIEPGEEAKNGVPPSPDEPPQGTPPPAGDETPVDMPGGEGGKNEPEHDESQPDDGGEDPGEDPGKDDEEPADEVEDIADPTKSAEGTQLDFQPRSGRVGEFVEYVITGYSFVPNLVIVMRKGNGLLMSPSDEIRETGFGGRLYLGDISPGTWSIWLKLPDGSQIPISGGFIVHE